MEKKIIFNPESNEDLNDRKIFGGNPDGMLNFTKMKYPWALKTWETMLANTWFSSEVNMNPDAKDYEYLSPAEKRMYDLVLAQLIFMDSLQTNNLMDNINPYITAPEINACLARQAYEEALHSSSYAVMVESISDNTDLIYNLWKTDEKLLEKNKYFTKQAELFFGNILENKMSFSSYSSDDVSYTINPNHFDPNIILNDSKKMLSTNGWYFYKKYKTFFLYKNKYKISFENFLFHRGFLLFLLY